MLDRLYDYTAALPLEQAVELTLQDVTIIRMWLDSQHSPTPFSKDLEARLQYWLNNPPEIVSDTEGRRHQLLLRNIMSVLITEETKDVQWDEFSLIIKARAMAKAANHAGLHTRFLIMTEPHLPLIQRRLDTLSPRMDMPTLERKLHIVTDRDLIGAPRRAIRLLAGIEMPSRGPIMQESTDIQVLGDVPDNCTIVLSNGSCVVSGYVMGRIVVKENCEVRGNVSGVIIALKGDVRARSIINNAHVVTKMGDVVCKTAQGPNLVFAGNRIVITDRTVMGRFIAPTMAVTKEVHGGEIHVSEAVVANRFGHSGPNLLSIILRSELTPEDYGEITGQELNRLLSQAYRLRQQMHNLDVMAQINTDKAETTSTSILMYLLGGGEVQKRLQELVSAQGRLDTINRLVACFETLSERAEDDLLRANTESARSDTVSLADVQEILNNPDAADENEAQDEDLETEKQTIQKIKASLTSKKLDRRQTYLILEELREKLTSLRREQDRLRGYIIKGEKDLHASGQYGLVVSKSEAGATKLQVLKELLPSFQKQPPESIIHQRMNSAFFKMAMRTITSRLKRAADYGERADKIRVDFHAVSNRLGEDFQIRVLETISSGKRNARASGKFDPGIRIFLDLANFEEKTPSKDSFITTPNQPDMEQVFFRLKGGKFYTDPT